MPESDDIALLKEYAENGSEPAFAALVERYVNLVYSAALRSAGNAHAAQEITQAVFIILARKANQLSRCTVLSGWLYQTARLTAANYVRGEIRRQNREQEAYMQAILNEPESEAWRQISPFLDDAMGRLGEKDRNAVVLRFFENKSLNEVGLALGASEDAAKMRVNRALDKLRKFFTKRGMTLSGAIIAGAVSANSVQAAPMALAKTISAVAVAKGAAASISTLTVVKGALKIMAWTKAKTAIAVGAALILTSGTSLMVVKEVHSQRTIHAALDGLPQTLVELNAWYVEPPAGQNAATFNLQGIKTMQITGADQNANLPILGKLPPPPPDAPLPPRAKSALADFIQQNRSAMQFFAQGAHYEQSRYPIDLTQGSQTLLPHLYGIKRGMQIMDMAAILDADNYDGKQAAEDVLTILALGRSLEAEPVLISQLVRAAGASIAVDGFNQIVNRATLPPESLSELLKGFQDMEAYDARGEGFKRGMAGELAIHLSLLKNPDELNQYLLADTIIPDNRRQRIMEYLKRPDSLKAEQDYFETSGQFMSSHQEPFPARLRADDVFRRAEAKATNRGLPLNAWFWSGLGGSVSREARCLADLRLALVAVTLEQFRAAHNQYPANLSELTPNYLGATPKDPFDGQPLRYRKQGAGYVLYSIGPDLKDDGGKRVNGKVVDLVFAVPTPPAS